MVGYHEYVSSVDVFMPGYRASTVDSVTVTGRRLAYFLAAIVVGLVRVITPHVLTLGGLASFVAAAFTVSILAGLLTLGAALFVFEWRISQE